MNSSDNFRTTWWCILVVVIGLYLFGRYDELQSGKPTYFDVVVFLVWVGVCLAPIFKEMDLFGVKLKQDIDGLRKDLGHQLALLKTEIKSSIEVSNANSNQIYVQTGAEPSKDSEIPDISDQVRRALEKLGISTSGPLDDFEAPSEQVELFKIRLAFERALRDYPFAVSDYRHRYSVGRMLQELRRYGNIPAEVVEGVQEVIAICNYAVHGEKVSEAQLGFVRDTAPGLLKALRAELRSGL